MHFCVEGAENYRGTGFWGEGSTDGFWIMVGGTP
jgi:hypothetical protein